MRQVRLRTNDLLLSNVLRNFETATREGLVSRIRYDEYRKLKGYLSLGHCPECDSSVPAFKLEDGTLTCPKCDEDYDTYEVSTFVGRELTKIYRSMISVDKAIAIEEPIENTNIKSEGENNMMNLNMGGMFKNLKFGPVGGDNFRLSPLGTAFKTHDGYSVYNAEKQELTDVTGMVFNMPNAIFAMPIAHKKVKVNDVIIHQGNAVVVTEIKDKTLMVVNPFASEVREVMPTKSVFGFNFYTRISALFDLGKANEDKPFGNMMPLMMMSGGMGANGEGGMNPMMMAMMMSGAMGDNKDGEDGEGMFGDMDPMMMAMMMGGMGTDQKGNNGMDMGGMMMAMAMTKMFKK